VRGEVSQILAIISSTALIHFAIRIGTVPRTQHTSIIGPSQSFSRGPSFTT
jgi:hypothetical protein